MFQEPILLEITKRYAVKWQVSPPGIDLIRFQSSKHQCVQGNADFLYFHEEIRENVRNIDCSTFKFCHQPCRFRSTKHCSVKIIMQGEDFINPLAERFPKLQQLSLLKSHLRVPGPPRDWQKTKRIEPGESVLYRLVSIS